MFQELHTDNDNDKFINSILSSYRGKPVLIFLQMLFSDFYRTPPHLFCLYHIFSRYCFSTYTVVLALPNTKHSIWCEFSIYPLSEISNMYQTYNVKRHYVHLELQDRNINLRLTKILKMIVLWDELCIPPHDSYVEVSTPGTSNYKHISR